MARRLPLALCLLSGLIYVASEDVPQDDGLSPGRTVAFNDSKYNSEVCAKFNTFYHKRFEDGIDYNACHLLYNYPNFAQQFEDFLALYKFVFPNTTNYNKRFAIFSANLLYIMVENQKHKHYTIGVNEFAALSPDEFAASHTGLTLGDAPPASSSQAYSGTTLPTSLDWLVLGAVTNPPNNQGTCNSCWAFATVGALEGAWKIQTGQLVPLSEQQFVDCTGHGLGCVRGGNLETPISSVGVPHAICSAESYRYDGKDGQCTQSDCNIVIPKGVIKGFVNVAPNDENALMEALFKQGPVAVGINAGGNQVMLYSSGVLSATCTDDLNHAVLLIGYGMQGDTKYWKLKNSWGKRWGEGGFFRLIRGLPGSGECGVKAIPTYPKLDTSGLGALPYNASRDGGASTSAWAGADGRPSTGVFIIGFCVLGICAMGALAMFCCPSDKGSHDRGLRFFSDNDSEEEDESEEGHE